MKRTVLIALLSLHCSSLTSCATECHEDGPKNCTFYTLRSHTFCNWFPGDHFEFDADGFGHSYCARLSREAEQGELTSRKACSTQGQTHCLHFQYRFKQNNVLDLSVSIRYGTDEDELLTWIMSSGDGWNNASLPVNTTRNFNIVFKANRRPDHLSNTSTVLIDDIFYSKSSCRFGLFPPDAQPTTTTTPTTPMNTSNVGITVGVIVAILIFVLIVITVLLVVFRRKHVQFWKACCGEKQPKEEFHMNSFHNGAYSLDADEQSHPNGAVSNHTQQNSHNHRLDTRTSEHDSSNNHCYENTPPNNPSEPVYTKVNKPGKVPHESSLGNKSKPNSPVYEMCNKEAANCSNNAGTEYQNLSPTMAKQEQDSSSPLPTRHSGPNLAQPQKSSPVYILEKEPGTERNSVHHVPNASVTATAQGHGEEYNSLDFDTKGLGETNSFDEAKTERATGGVYSHLNEGDGDTYNEVHREKRDGVVDGVYSHIK